MTNERKNNQAQQIKVLGKGAGTNLFGKLVGRTLHIAAQVLLARWLGPALFGLYAIGWNMLRVAAILLPLGMDNGVIRLGAAKWPRDKQAVGRVAITSTSLTFGIGLLAGAAFYFASPWLAGSFGKPELSPVLRTFSLAVPFAGGLKVAASATRITQRMRFGILSEELAQPAINLVLIVAILGGGALSLGGTVWAVVISFALAFVLAAFYVLSNFGRIRIPECGALKRESRALLNISLPVGAATVFATLVLLVDRIIVGFFLPEEDAGIYQAISIFSVFFVTVLSAFKIIVAPMIPSLYSKRKHFELEELFRVSTRWVLYLILPAAAVILIAPVGTIAAVFGEGYSTGALSLVVLTLAQLANSATGAIEHFLIMTQNQRSWLKISALMFAINIILNILLVLNLGVVGAAISALVTFAGTSLLCLIQVKRRVQIWPYDRRYLKGFLASAVMTLVLIGFSRLGMGPTLMQITFLGIAAYISFGAVIFALGLEREDRQILEMIRKSILRKVSR